MPGLPKDTRFINPVTAHGPFACDAGAARPNVFQITVDMVPPEAYRRDGYRDLLRTPAFDALEADCVTFGNAFTTSPLCGPSRAAFLTGRYSYMTVNEERAHDGSAFALRDDDIIFPEYLRAGGYVTRHAGKCHVGTAAFLRAFGENDRPWDRWAPPLWDDDAYHAYLESLGLNGMRLTREIRGLRQDGRSPGNLYGAWLEQADGAPFPIEGTYPVYLATRALEAVRQARRWCATDGQPLYMQLDFFAPHQPFMIPSGMADREAALREIVELPTSYREAVAADLGPLPGEPKIYGTYRRAHGLRDEGTMRDYIVANLLQMEVIDVALGRFLDGLRAEGLYDDAMVLFFADHGEMNGERALVDKGTYCHPKVARVPLWLRLPNAANAGATVDTPVTLLDVAPTVLEAAGLSPHARLDGESLLGVARGDGELPARDFIFEAGWHLAPNPAVAMPMRLEDGRLVLFACNLTSTTHELYDLADPAHRNRIDTPDGRALLPALVRRMAAFLRAAPRWRCYWHPFRVEFEPLLEVEEGDHQMFVPE